MPEVPVHRRRSRRWRPVTSEAPLTRDRADRRRAGLPGVVPGAAAAAVFAEALRKGVASLSSRRSAGPGRARCDPPDPDGGGHRRAAERRLRHRRGLGHRQVRVPGQERADHPDRPAVLGLAGRLGPGLRAAVRRAGPASARGCSATASRSSSPCPASCWRRCS